MTSKRVFDAKQASVSSRLAAALKSAIEAEQEIRPPDGQFGFKCTIQTPYAILNNFASESGEGFDMEFEIPFDDDLIANEAKFIVYNLSQDTIRKFKKGQTFRCIAGYSDDTGIIFEGYIDRTSTKYDGIEKITTIYAVDDVDYSPEMMNEVTYAEGTSAQYILKELLSRLGLPIAVFKPQRDHIYDSETKISGNIVENIKTYADVCGCSVYVNFQQVYCRPIWDGDNLHFNVNADTGMIGSPELFIEENQNEEYIDTVHGYNVEMIFQKRLNTAGIVNLNSKNYAGQYRVVSGSHNYDGTSATTKFKCIEAIFTEVDTTKISGKKGSGSAVGVINSAVEWAVDIANDDSHGYSQSVRWGPHYDCSSFVISAYDQAGVPVKSGGATYTGDMKRVFLDNGFEDVTSSVNLSNGSGLKKGDVLLNETHHAALVQEDGGKIVHASSSKTGIVANRSYYNYPWDCVLRYARADVEVSDDGTCSDWITKWRATTYGYSGDDNGICGWGSINYRNIDGCHVAVPQFCIKQSSYYDTNKIQKYCPELSGGYGTVLEVRSPDTGKSCKAVVADCGGMGPEGSFAGADKQAMLDLPPNTQKALGLGHSTYPIEYRVVGHIDSWHGERL